MTGHVSAEKKGVVADFVQLIDSYPIVGVVNMENLPATQLQRMRASLRNQGIVLRMTKRRLIFKALDEAKKKDIAKLKEYTTGMPAMIFTKENPFALFKQLKKNQSKAPIKGGQKAPDDIVVPAGPTSFAPGPIIGELGSVGVKTMIQDGKIAVREDSRVAKAGDTISPKLAALLTRLGIEPMRIGLDLTACYENGEILTRSVLDVDEDAVKAQLATMHYEAVALAMDIAFPTSETTDKLLQKAFMDATVLALDRDVVNKETIKPMLGKAYAMTLAVSGLLPDEALSAEAQAAVGAQHTAAAAPAAEKKEEKKPEAPAGLGSLFD